LARGRSFAAVQDDIIDTGRFHTIRKRAKECQIPGQHTMKKE
jgi:hypothetical protein